MNALRHAVLLLTLLSTVAADALPWRSGGPRGGAVNALVRAVSDPNVWYIAAIDGVFRSTDNGQTWAKVSALDDVRRLVVDPADPWRLYALEDATLFRPKVYRSTDGGATWQTITQGLPEGESFSFRANTLLADRRDPRRLYLASGCFHDDCRGGGLFLSVDGGDSWTRLGAGSWPLSISQDPLTPDTLYSTDVVGGYMRSDDSGRTWVKVPSFVPSYEVVADPGDAMRRYGIGEVPFLLTSPNAGAAWAGDNVRTASGAIPYWNDAELEVERATGRLFIGTGPSTPAGAYRSGDGGVSWAPLGNEGREPVRAMTFDDTTGALVIGTFSGVYRSASVPYDHWTEVPVGHLGHVARKVVTHPRRPGTLFTISANRLFRSDDYGATWVQAAEPLPLVENHAPLAVELAVDGSGDVYVVAGFVRSTLARLPAGSREWVVVDRNAAQFVVADPSVPGTVYAIRDGRLAVTRDRAATWEPLPFPGLSPSDLAIDPTNPRHLIAVAQSPTRIVRSTDGGATWTTVIHGGIIVSSSIAISAQDPKRVTFLARAALDERVVFQSTDGGATWTTIKPVTTDGSQLDFWYFDTLLADPRNARTLYVRTLRSSLFRSTDGGATWHSFRDGLPAVPLHSIAIDADGRFLHAGTSASVWDLPLTPARRRSVGGR
jgi:photosystem II stability/assembly factor-like uncharacterized protein